MGTGVLQLPFSFRKSKGSCSCLVSAGCWLRGKPFSANTKGSYERRPKYHLKRHHAQRKTCLQERKSCEAASCEASSSSSPCRGRQTKKKKENKYIYIYIYMSNRDISIEACTGSRGKPSLFQFKFPENRNFELLDFLKNIFQNHCL